MRPPRYAPLPVTSRYLLREFLVLFLPIVLAFVLLYLLVDFFDRLDGLLKNHATAWAALRYFLFKIPLIVTQTLPPAALAAMLISLGMLARRNEITALRASGVSLLQTAAPLLMFAVLICLGALAWNETVVPYCTRQSEYINIVEIRKRPLRGILNEREVWYHGANGFYNIDNVDSRRGTLFGLRIYRTDPAFNLVSIVEVPTARWTPSGWVASHATEHAIGPNGEVLTRQLSADQVHIPETMNDFLEVHREPEELSYSDLHQRIQELTRKGIDASSYLVDLNLKLAVPFTTFVLACVAVPLAGRIQRHASIAATVGTGFAIGFAYWVTLALANSLGQSGVLPAVVAAWTANVIFLLAGVGLFLSSE
jgi:lipopolysaccharide export system permease protein